MKIQITWYCHLKETGKYKTALLNTTEGGYVVELKRLRILNFVTFLRQQ